MKSRRLSSSRRDRPVPKVADISSRSPGLVFLVSCRQEDHPMAVKKKDDSDEGIKVICRNKRAFHEYNISDRLECGLVLTGTEVKSLREGNANLEDAYARLEDSELWLIGCDIPEYTM